MPIGKIKRLHEKHYAAIAILAQPKRGGLKLSEVAEEVGIGETTLREWRKDDKFNEELKKQVMRNSIDRLPEIVDSIPKHIIEDGNAAMLRTYMQALGMLTEKHEIETKESTGDDVKALKEDIERFRKKADTDE